MTWGETSGSPSGAAAATAPAPDVVPAPSLGVTLGAYRLVHRLGEGGMGVVHLGLDAHGRAVAIKVLRAHVAHDPDARARLSREVATLSRVRHPLVAEVLDADVDGDQPFVVTRYVPGLTLDAEVRERGPMPAAHLVRLGRGLSSALEAIHGAGVVHRDLKPGNVLMLDDDPVVIDFGIAHVADDARLTMTGLVMGTPGYLSPELLNGAAVTEATDWWGWAATLAFAASGHAPYGNGPADAVIDRVRRGSSDLTGVDERLRPLLLAALSPDPERRPGAPEVLAALERYALGGLATVAVPAAAQPGPGTRPYGAATSSVSVPATRPFAAAPPYEPSYEPYDPSDGPDDPLQVFRPPEQALPPAPPAPKPRRTGTLLALLVALVGCGSCWPTVTALVLAALAVAARTVDQSLSAHERRTHDRGPSRGEPLVAVLTAPVHLLLAALGSITGLALAAVLGVSAAFCAGVVPGSTTVAASGSPNVAPAQLAAAAGFLVAALVLWWGPGSASVRRGSRAMARGLVRGNALTALVVVVAVAGGLGAAYLCATRGQPEFWPLHQLPLGIHLS
jgi:serine/threonine protein kinase